MDLTYRVRLHAGWESGSEADAIDLGSDFSAVLRGEELTIKTLKPFSSIAEARAIVESRLASWAAQQELSASGAIVRIEFAVGRLLDKRSDGPRVHHVELAARVDVAGRLHLVAPFRPLPVTQTFALTPMVERLMERLRAAREGRSRWLVEAEYVQTALRRELPKHTLDAMNVAGKVLDNLGRLATHSHLVHGRTIKANAEPLSAVELEWIQVVLPILVRRLGEVEGGAQNLPEVNMSHLPRLP